MLLNYKYYIYDLCLLQCEIVSVNIIHAHGISVLLYFSIQVSATPPSTFFHSHKAHVYLYSSPSLLSTYFWLCSPAPACCFKVGSGLLREWMNTAVIDRHLAPTHPPWIFIQESLLQVGRWSTWEMRKSIQDWLQEASTWAAYVGHCLFTFHFYFPHWESRLVSHFNGVH